MSEGDIPIFVKIEDYKDVINVIDLLKNKLSQAKDLLEKINELKEEEDSELDLWKGNIDEIEDKIETIDDSLINPQLD